MHVQEGSDERFSDLVFENQCVFQVSDGKVCIYPPGYQKRTIQGGLIDSWALGRRYWSLPQLLLHFGSMTQDGFRIPKQLGDNGGTKRSPDWVRHIFPGPFLMVDSDSAKARRMVGEYTKE